MSNTINNGGPAFPIPLHPGQTYTAHALCDGMTLRDYFAAKALPVAWEAYDKGYTSYESEDVTTNRNHRTRLSISRRHAPCTR